MILNELFIRVFFLDFAECAELEVQVQVQVQRIYFLEE